MLLIVECYLWNTGTVLYMNTAPHLRKQKSMRDAMIDGISRSTNREIPSNRSYQLTINCKLSNDHLNMTFGARNSGLDQKLARSLLSAPAASLP